MRRISADEALLLSSLFSYPELILAYNDLDNHYFSELGWITYLRLISSDVEDIIKLSAITVVAMSLLREKHITSEEFQFMVDDFGVIPNSQTAEEAYGKLKESFEFLKTHSELANILNKARTLNELKDNVSKTISDISSTKTDKLINIMDAVDIKESCGFNFDMGDLDYPLDIEKTDLIVIAGRPFSGKSTFAVQLAMGLTRFGRVDFWSMEMSARRIKEKVDKYGEAYKPENFFITNPVNTSLQRLCRASMVNKPVAIFIDQFNKIKGQGKTEYEQFTSIARGLKELAVYLKIPIFCLAQINRDAQDGRPYMFQLKGSGSIEEEADVVMLLHVPEENKTNLYLDKNRTHDGKLGKYELTFGKIYSSCRKIL